MCEHLFTISESDLSIREETCEPRKRCTLPLLEETCKGQRSPLAQFANEIQLRIKKDEQAKPPHRACSDFNEKYTLNHQPDYHNVSTNEQCEREGRTGNINDDMIETCIEEDRDLANAGAQFVTLRIANDAGSDTCEPILLEDLNPSLAAYVRQILDGHSQSNAIFGITFEPYYMPDKKSKRNPYRVLHPSVIENLLKKLISSSDLTPEDLKTYSEFINVVSRLNIEDIDAYFRMLRARGVALADVVDNFRKKFWQLKSAVLSTRDVERFVKSVKRAVLFGDPNDVKKQRAQSARRLAKALEEALAQAEQWAKELVSKKIDWPTAKLVDAGKTENKSETKPLVPTLKKPTIQPIKDDDKKTKREADPKSPENLTGKKDDLAGKTQAGPDQKTSKTQVGTDQKTSKTQVGTDQKTSKTQVGTDQKASQGPTGIKDDALAQKDKEAKNKKEKTASSEKSAKTTEIAAPSEQVGKDKEGKNKKERTASSEKSMQKTTAKQEPTPSSQTSQIKDKRTGRRSVSADDKSLSVKDVKVRVTSKQPIKATSQEPYVDDMYMPDAEEELKQQKKQDNNFDVDPRSDAAEKISNMNRPREPERDFRQRLAAALSAAQKYADKTLYVPDVHGVDDLRQGSKRFTFNSLDTDGKPLLRSGNKFYNDSSQLLERFSFISTGAHHPGYYEPWDVEFPWPDLQELTTYMAKFYMKPSPDPNFSYRRGMEFYQSMFRRESEELNSAQSNNDDQKDKKQLSKKVR